MSWRFNRKNSRVSRLIRLRVTAFPTFLVTVIPRRIRPKRLGRYLTIKYASWIFLPPCASATKSGRFKMRSALVKLKPCNSCLPSSCGDTRRLPSTASGPAPTGRSRLFSLYRQTLPSLGSAPIDDPSALFGRHSFQKTVIAGTFDSTRLIRPFHKTNLG